MKQLLFGLMMLSAVVFTTGCTHTQGIVGGAIGGALIGHVLTAPHGYSERVVVRGHYYPRHYRSYSYDRDNRYNQRRHHRMYR